LIEFILLLTNVNTMLSCLCVHIFLNMHDIILVVDDIVMLLS